MAVHRAAKTALMPAIANAKSTRRAYDPLLDDIDEHPSEAELAALPDPSPLLAAIATMLIEILSGGRSLDHLASLVSDQVYEKLRARVHGKAIAANGGRPPLMPKFAVGKMRTDRPKLGIVESVVLLTMPDRTRAVTIRLEPFHKRWRATSVTIL